MLRRILSYILPLSGTVALLTLIAVITVGATSPSSSTTTVDARSPQITTALAPGAAASALPQRASLGTEDQKSTAAKIKAAEKAWRRHNKTDFPDNNGSTAPTAKEATLKAPTSIEAAVATHATSTPKPLSQCRPKKAYSPRGRSTPLVGFVADPYKIASYQQAVGADAPISMYSVFDAWGRGRNPAKEFAAAKARNLIPYVTWEPWGGATDTNPEKWTMRKIARGTHDAYIRTWAQAIKTHRGPVYLRLAHEMNGQSYPWSLSSGDYRRAWKHIVRLMRKSGATNAKFVFAPNANTYQPIDEWCSDWTAYYPGDTYVDAVGMTTIQFGGLRKDRYSVAEFAERLGILRWKNKPVFLTEANAARQVRKRWYSDLATFVRATPWVTGVSISQAPSLAQHRGEPVGDLSWDIRKDKKTLPSMRRLITGRR